MSTRITRPIATLALALATTCPVGAQSRPLDADGAPPGPGARTFLVASAQEPGAQPAGASPAAAVNAPPRVFTAAAVVTNTFRLPVVTRLAGRATDDGKPKPPKLTTLWTQISGPANASIANRKSTNTQVTLNREGTYRFRLTASDGQLSGSSTARVDVILRPNTPPDVEAGPNRTVILPNPPPEALVYPPPTLRITMTGSVKDDGYPTPPGKVSSTWSRLSGPAAVIFSKIQNPITDATFTKPGNYVLQLRASDGALVASDAVAVTVLSPATDCIELRPQTSRNCPFPGDELWAFNTTTQRTIGFTVRIYYDNLWTPDTTEDLTFSLRPGQSTFVSCTYRLTYPKYRIARVIDAWDIGTASLLSAPSTGPSDAPAE